MLETILEYERTLFLWLNGGHTLYWDHFFWIYSGKMVWIPLALFVLWVICYKRPWKESLLILLFIALTLTLCDQFASSVCKPYLRVYALRAIRILCITSKRLSAHWRVVRTLADATDLFPAMQPMPSDLLRLRYFFSVTAGTPITLSYGPSWCRIPAFI